MSNDPTRPLPGWPQQPGRPGQAGPPRDYRPGPDYHRSAPAAGRGAAYRPASPGRRRHRGLTITAIVVVVVLILLVIADRAAAAYADNRVADQIKAAGFPVKPKVTIGGFPFLTQVLARDLGNVTISASNVPEGPLDIASMNATAHGVHINASFNGATIDQLNGTALITFAGLSQAAGVGDGVTLANGGGNRVKATVDLGFLNGTALFQVARTGGHEISVRVVSAGSLPVSALGSLQDFNVSIPNLPAGMSVQSVSVTAQGVLVDMAGSHTTLSQ
jgi:hypothetical protein